MKEKAYKLTIISRSVKGGGAERVVSLLANNLCKDTNFIVSLLTAKIEREEYFLENEVKRFCILDYKDFAKNVKVIRTFLQKNNIDIALGMGVHENLCLCLASLGLKTKIVISERNAPKQDALSKKTKLLRWLLYRMTDNMVFQTKEAQSFYSESIQKRSCVIHNPVKTNLPKRTGACKKEIIAIGRLHVQKNYIMLIHAFSKISKKYPDYILKIYGEGKEKENIKKEIDCLGMSNRIILEGYCQNIHERIVDSDIYVMTSSFEGMPNSLMEAMAMGFPVICTNCPAGGPRELIEDNINGCLIEVDEEELERKITYLIENPEEKERLGKAARNISNSHNEEKIIKQWKNYFMEILEVR